MTASAQVSGLHAVTITASEAAWPRLAAPILLPKWAAALALRSQGFTVTISDCALRTSHAPLGSGSGYADGQVTVSETEGQEERAPTRLVRK
jgi:hypothetical protein